MAITGKSDQMGKIKFVETTLKVPSLGDAFKIALLSLIGDKQRAEGVLVKGTDVAMTAYDENDQLVMGLSQSAKMKLMVK